MTDLITLDMSSQAAKEAAVMLVKMINQSSVDLIDSYRKAHDFLWNHPDGIAAEAITAELGNQAHIIFKISAANLQFLSACAVLNGKTLDDLIAQADYLPLKTLVFNEGGTVTLL